MTSRASTSTGSFPGEEQVTERQIREAAKQATKPGGPKVF
jgi:hypothetical protein